LECDVQGGIDLLPDQDQSDVVAVEKVAQLFQAAGFQTIGLVDL